MEFLMNLFLFVGRVLISAMFLWSAFEKMQHWGATVARMHSKHVPQPNIILAIFLILKVVGGLLVLVGWHAHIGALLLLIVMIPSLYWMHPFWKVSGPEHKLERALFMKEVAIIGGLFLLLSMGAGTWGFGGF